MKPPNENGAEPGSHRAEKRATPAVNHTPGHKSIPVAVAWYMGGDVFRVQANSPEAARLIARIPGARQTGYSVLGAFLRLFDFVSNEIFIRRISAEIGGSFLSESRQRDLSDAGKVMNTPGNLDAIPVCPLGCKATILRAFRRGELPRYKLGHIHRFHRRMFRNGRRLLASAEQRKTRKSVEPGKQNKPKATSLGKKS